MPVLQKVRITILLLAVAVSGWRCIQSYVSPYISPVTGYLVVEGYITGNGPTYFKLSRTIALPGDSAIPVVTGARLQVEGSDNSVYPFTEIGNGQYVLPSIFMNASTQYRLRISNINNEVYLSSYVPYKPTPPIDSISWGPGVDTGGVEIYVNTHDPTGNTRFYRWDYDETWEYHSSEESGYIYQGDTLAQRTAAQQIYTCYHSDSSSSILLGTSDKLVQDDIYEEPLIHIDANSQQLGIEYTVLVHQYSLTDSAYDYLSLMQANTEQLGTIFDPQPSELVGNIRSLTNPSESVIGFISAGTLQQQRIFISRSQVPGWIYYFECPKPDIRIDTVRDTLVLYFDYLNYVPVDIPTPGKVLTNVQGCIDCRVQGGVTQEPSFWPN